MNLLTLREVATVMKVSESTVRRLIQSGSLTAYKIGQRGQLRIKEKDLERYLESMIVQTDSKDEDKQDAPAQDQGGEG